MDKVNQMVKDKKCPRNLRNRFYQTKTKIIEAYLEDGKVSEVYDEGNCYSVLLDGKYRFHQLKATHPKWGNKLTIEGTREYEANEPIPFNKDVYKNFFLSSSLFLAERRYAAEHPNNKTKN
jgi:hypothetical protein